MSMPTYYQRAPLRRGRRWAREPFLSTACGLRGRLEGGQSHQVEGERRPGRRQLDPVDREVAPPSLLPVRRHGLRIPGQHHLVVRFLPHVRDYVYTEEHDTQPDRGEHERGRAGVVPEEHERDDRWPDAHPERPGEVEHPSPALLRESKERSHEVAEVPTIHRLEHRAHDRAQHPQEARPETGEESRRCECPFLGRHDDPPLNSQRSFISNIRIILLYG